MSLPNLATLSKHTTKINRITTNSFYMDDNIELMHNCDKNHSCNFTSFLSAKESNKMVKIVIFVLNKLDALYIVVSNGSCCPGNGL